MEILDPATYERMDEMVDTMVALRKGKMTAEECRASLQKGNYFGTMLGVPSISKNASLIIGLSSLLAPGAVFPYNIILSRKMQFAQRV